MKQGFEEHRREAESPLQPSAGKDRAEDVEVFLGAHAVALEIGAEVGIRHAEIVVKAVAGGVTLLGQVSKFGDDRLVLEVDQRRAKPLEEGRVGFLKQAKSFAEIPAAEIQIAGKHFLDDIAGFGDGEIPIARVDVKKAHIPIAIRGSKTPGSATRFHGVENPHAVTLLDGSKLGSNAIGNGIHSFSMNLPTPWGRLSVPALEFTKHQIDGGVELGIAVGGVGKDEDVGADASQV